MTSELSREEILRYSRHLMIPEVGISGQKKLKGSKALIIGTGGLGSPVALYLAAAGVGKIGIVDFDKVEASNLQRQIIHGTDNIGVSKVNSAKKRMLDINPDIEVVVYEEQFSSENAMRIASDYQVIIDGSDNFPTRYLTNDVCVFLGIPNVYGSIYRFDGQASVFYTKEGPCYRCLFPEPPPPGLVPSCADGGVLGILPGTIGTIQATEALKLLLGISSSLVGRLLLYNALDMSFEFVKLKKNSACRICGTEPDIHALIDYKEFCGVPSDDRQDNMYSGLHDISPEELARKISEGEDIVLLDVREPHELEISTINGSRLIPLGQLVGRLDELAGGQEIVVFCKSGSRSRRALEILINSGIKNVKNLKGGINAWARIIDRSIPIY
jgi:molybdopterin/thiamine biosynthesis adenylyltransferase/rhodanese-related sulfurtransferase